MPLSSLFSDIYTSLTISPVNAEAPPVEEHEGSSDLKAEEKRSAEPEPKEEESAGGGAETEEEEPEDVMGAITEGIMLRVKRMQASKASLRRRRSRRRIVWRIFHLMHCSAQCAAPKIWAKLK
ncbi:unnamed protein product [Tuber melanosporum]|uniref:(Perigord truffle) hypothetical protein n=1 Tax=Tuber melanosporum (strain Mel28) TaxID=656061 RepID=D5GCA6_TUBMM|nr:uncharacterized protein GSTUM_00000652001 [Tuber melanosporum]CAZ82149.1 unnamed protein product [Tuber melanosporum]